MAAEALIISGVRDYGLDTIEDGSRIKILGGKGDKDNKCVVLVTNQDKTEIAIGKYLSTRFDLSIVLGKIDFNINKTAFVPTNLDDKGVLMKRGEICSLASDGAAKIKIVDSYDSHCGNLLKIIYVRNGKSLSGEEDFWMKVFEQRRSNGQFIG